MRDRIAKGLQLAVSGFKRRRAVDDPLFRRLAGGDIEGIAYGVDRAAAGVVFEPQLRLVVHRLDQLDWSDRFPLVARTRLAASIISEVQRRYDIADQRRTKG